MKAILRLANPSPCLMSEAVGIPLHVSAELTTQGICPWQQSAANFNMEMKLPDAVRGKGWYEAGALDLKKPRTREAGMSTTMLEYKEGGKHSQQVSAVQEVESKIVSECWFLYQHTDEVHYELDGQARERTTTRPLASCLMQEDLGVR